MKINIEFNAYAVYIGSMDKGKLKQPLVQYYYEQRGCRNKKFYTTKKRAKDAARLRKKALKGGFLRAYKCTYCPNFHIGHPYAGRPENANKNGGLGETRTHNNLLKRQEL